MRLLPRTFGRSLQAGVVLSALLLLPASRASAQTTTITGTVYSPNGPAKGDPIPNILVFVAGGPVSDFTAAPTGPGVQYGCKGQEALVTGNPIASATTDYRGNFTLSSPGLTALGTATVNLVIQAGKWRRQYPTTQIVGGQVNNLSGLTMPGAKGILPDGTIADLPHIAIVTGKVDGLECIFPQIGISTAEVTNPDGTGSINLYAGSASPGAVVTASTSADPTPPETTLVTNLTLMNSYDVIMFACQGTPTQPVETTTSNQSNILAYSTNGGRIFTTHWQYLWLDSNATFPTVADWLPPPPLGTTATSTATINTTSTFTEGLILANWMHYIGADTGTLGQIILKNTAVNTSLVHTPPSQSWVNLNTVSGTPSMQFTFDTPIGQNGVPTVGIAYTNNTQTFKPGDTGDSITITATNTSTTDTDATLTMALTVPASLTVTSLADTSGGTWTCGNLVCTRSTPLIAGASDAVTLTFNIAANIVPGQVSITTSLSGGNLSSTGQCGRVLFNDYHVEQQSVAKNTIFPAECSTGTLTPQEKFLEFSLYNLSNFISPTATDVIIVQGTPTLTWANPSAIYYGTPLSGTQLNASATFNGNTVPGTFVYTPPTGTILNVTTAPQQLCVVFTPADTIDYATPPQVCVQITVIADATTTALTTPVSPIFYGQIIAQAATGSAVSAGPATINSGTLNFYIGTPTTTPVLVCSLSAVTLGPCPPSTGAGYSVGTYTVQACYADAVDLNFTGSCSPVYSVVIQPDPTSTSVTSSADPSTPNQLIAIKAQIVDQYAIGSGTVQFFDNSGVTPLLLGSAPADPTGLAALSISNLIVGTHNISACLLPSLNFLASAPCGTLVQLVILVPAPPLATVTLLTSSGNPSIVSQAVNFAASVGTTGAFLQAPTGTITFYDGTTALNTAPLDPTGAASFSTASLTTGTHPISAVYSGNASLGTSTSQTVQQVVLLQLPSPGTGFLLQVTPTTLSVGAGSSAVIHVTVLSLNNYNQPVQLSCSGLPAEATCTFAQSLMPVGGGATTMTISAAAPHNCGSNQPYFIATGGFPTTLPLLSLTALSLIRRRRRLLQGLTLAAALLLLPTLNGCSSACTDFGTQPGTYTFTVTGTSTGSTPTSQSQTIQIDIHI